MGGLACLAGSAAEEAGWQDDQEGVRNLDSLQR